MRANNFLYAASAFAKSPASKAAIASSSSGSIFSAGALPTPCSAASAKTLSMTPESYVKLKVQEKFADAVADAADNNQPFALGFPANNTPTPASSK